MAERKLKLVKHSIFYTNTVGDLDFYSHDEPCDCAIGENHWADDSRLEAFSVR